jgi:integrase
MGWGDWAEETFQRTVDEKHSWLKGTGIFKQTPHSSAIPASLTKEIPNLQALELHLLKKGRSPRTIKNRIKELKELAKRADLTHPQEVELAIAKYKKKNGRSPTNGYKNLLLASYSIYCDHFEITWKDRPKYTREEKSIQPPTDERIAQFVAAARSTLSLKIQISQQTGLRPIEITGEKGLQSKDIHTDQQTITARSAKGCNARPPIRITPELTARIQAHITRKNLKPDDILFKEDSEAYSNTFTRFKTRLAKKLNDPQIENIRLYDIRHAYVTRQLRKTQNTEIVRQIVGHKNLNTTQKYLHLLAGTTGEWIVESTTDQKRADELLKQDFTYVLTIPDGYMKFRKPK